ncbi:helix-turn-helix domain-containing protein [Streptomyces sp. NPDC096068]|uniref:helix-turn-helix domain-containing protein n=1 Tax=Streptomyces sp. NPDC096068 TaxID=3155424 RepID=UPI00331DC44F
MSVEATVWALKFAPPMPPQFLGTLLGLADHADAKGRGAYPSIPTLAAYTCKSERSVQRDLKGLREEGLIRAGDESLVAHIPADRRPEVYDLAVERVVPGGRAGDEDARAEVAKLVSARARGGKKGGVTPTSPRRGDAHVTTGVTPTSERGDVGVANGVTPTSPKPSFEPPMNPPMNQRGAGVTPTSPGLAPVEVDGFALTDAMRRWAHATYPGLDIDHSTAQFVSHYRSTGARRKSWPDAWQKWIRDDAARRPRNVYQLPTGQTLTGTDAKVAGWMAIAQELAQNGDSA